jgi:assimilatory nitrate reductase catalytic subunit
LVVRSLAKRLRGECIRYEDTSAKSSREAWIENGRLEHVLFVGARLPPRDWLVAAFAEESVSDDTRRFLLHGRAPNAVLDTSRIVCACAGVSANIITAAIAAGAATLDAIGAATRAGVTCGSCRTEVSRLLTESPATEKRDAA